VNPGRPRFLGCAHLAHVDVADLDRVIARVNAKNAAMKRKLVDGLDSLLRVSRKDERLPARSATCWYCGRLCVWGGNGITGNLMCSGARELNDFLCVKTLAYVATSDAYSLDKIGTRFSWLRMGEPSLEAMRQAFLDHDARIICNWDSRLASYPNGDPNEMRHGWIKSLTIGGDVGNARKPLVIPLHPGPNTIIGGRGSGKSTLVAGLRMVYASKADLPGKIRVEADAFAAAIFVRARLEATHLLPNSQKEQIATWSRDAGALTRHAVAADVPTTFKVRVVNQKELFERVSRDKDDPFAASRSFLAFVDESLGFGRVPNPAAGTWWRDFETAGVSWTAAMRSDAGGRSNAAPGCPRQGIGA